MIQTQQHNKKVAIISAIFCTLMTASGQILWKLGVKNITNSGIIEYLNIFIILGFLTYGLGAILLIIALKNWELSRVHPFLSLGYIWITLFAPIVLNEIITGQRILGIGIIVIGVFFIGKK